VPTRERLEARPEQTKETVVSGDFLKKRSVPRDRRLVKRSGIASTFRGQIVSIRSQKECREEMDKAFPLA